MARLGVRLTDRMFRQLEALALERGVTRDAAGAGGVGGGSAGPRAGSAPDVPSEEELLELLAEKARMGNVAAIRALLVREEQKDPGARALALFQEMAERRQ